MVRQHSFFRHLVLLVSVVAMIWMAGCSSKKPKPEEDSAVSGGGVPSAPAADENLKGDSDSGKAMGLQTVHFPYDSFTLDSENKHVLQSNASILRENHNLKVQIEGHCDQRGGIQYNIALGEKRANAARKFLEDQGIASNRITIISFGKEKLIDMGTSDDAYSRNRRDNFVITSD